MDIAISNLFSDPLHPALIISKTLSETDIKENMRLPKQEIEYVLAIMGGVTAEELQIGKKVIISDLVEGDQYEVFLKYSDTKKKYTIGEGWAKLRDSLDLEEGQTLKLYWYQDFKIFVILNFPYNLLD
ncbi:unnamed protein product [Eruca vesicaria subsp. sativa]|uniref:TF-B3 domain-containing protein n=1 Tax=Eruca vesicaria subsp. sativa TaxID=29727 RepID=A0ABC8LKE5_ERUVS|nr:unnamed protein product [Eruca vesicaria subsp. sativa]